MKVHKRAGAKWAIEPDKPAANSTACDHEPRPILPKSYLFGNGAILGLNFL